MFGVTTEKANFWSSEEYSRIMDAFDTNGDAIDKLMDTCDHLKAVIDVLTNKLGLGDSEVVALMGVQSDLLEHINALIDGGHDMLEAIG